MGLRSHRFCLPAGLILCLAIIFTISVKTSAMPVSNQSALARIDKIVINDQVVSNADISQVKVVRASDKTEVPGEIGLSLYANDRVITGAAQIVLRHLSGGQTQSITLIENSNIVILNQSVMLIFGRIWVKASGFFSVKTLYWVLGVSGTRFWVEVSPPEKRDQVDVPEKSNLSVLEGAVDVSSFKNDAAAPQSPDPSNSQAANPSQKEVLRVKNSEEVDLVGGQPLPSAARPLSQEKINYLLRLIEQVESAGNNDQPQPTPSPSPIWKTAKSAGLAFDVPSDFEVTSGVTRSYLVDGSSSQNIDLNYLTAANSNKSGFASAGYAEVLIAPDSQGDMNGLAIRSLSQILQTFSIPGVGPVELDLFNAQVSSLKTMGKQVVKTTAVSKVNGRKYGVYFALTFRKTVSNAATMVFIVTGFSEVNINNTYTSVARILSSFKEPANRAGNANAAKEVVSKLVAENFGGIRANFNEEMKRKLSPEMMRAAWISAIQRTGKYQAQIELRRDPRRNYNVYTIRCQMEHGTLEVEVSFDENGKIGGLWIRPF